MTINLKEELEAGAAAYDEMLGNDPQLKREMEAKDRMFKDRQAVKKAKEAKIEENKKKLKKFLKRRARRRFHWF